MATGRKNAKKTMNYTETFFSGVDKLAEEKKMTRDEVLDCLERAIASGYEMNEQEAANFGLKDQKESRNKKYVVEIDRQTGEIVVSISKKVVETVENPDIEISLEEARMYDPEFIVGDDLYTDATPTSFEKMGRTTSAKIKTLFIQNISELERRNIEEKCKYLANEVISCEVELVEETEFFDVKANRYKKRRKVFATHDNIEFVMNEGDMLPNDSFKPTADREGFKTNYSRGKKEVFRALVLPVVEEKEEDKDKARGKGKDRKKEFMPRLTRTSDLFLEKLLASEVASIRDGRVEIKGVARKPGQRSKVAVYSNDPNVDAISACVGPGGQTISAVSDELKGEKIDVILWDPDLAVFVANALSPAKANHYPIVIEDDYEKLEKERLEKPDAKKKDKVGKVARVVLKNDQLTLAIGAKGINVALAATLCRCRIDIRGDGDEDNDTRRDREFLSDIMGG